MRFLVDYLNFLFLLKYNLNSVVCDFELFKLYIDVRFESSVIVYGPLKLKTNNSFMYIINYNQSLSIMESNLICGRLNFDVIHSATSLCSLKESMQSFDLFVKNSTCCQLYNFSFIKNNFLNIFFL